MIINCPRRRRKRAGPIMQPTAPEGGTAPLFLRKRESRCTLSAVSFVSSEQ